MPPLSRVVYSFISCTKFILLEHCALLTLLYPEFYYEQHELYLLQ